MYISTLYVYDLRLHYLLKAKKTRNWENWFECSSVRFFTEGGEALLNNSNFISSSITTINCKSIPLFICLIFTIVCFLDLHNLNDIINNFFFTIFHLFKVEQTMCCGTLKIHMKYGRIFCRNASKILNRYSAKSSAGSTVVLPRYYHGGGSKMTLLPRPR